jgi:predicted nucleic acid-binding protein
MSARSFFDTNVLVYTDDGDAPQKQRHALALFAEHRREGTGVTSTQVLQEYFAAATRKLGVSSDNARRKVELFAALDVATIVVEDVLAAIDLHRVHRLSFWDALILRSAKHAGCSVLFTEDPQDRGTIEGIRIVNPFRSEHR